LPPVTLGSARAGEGKNCVAGVAAVRMEAAVERLLRVAFGRFVQGGKLRITTADGAAFAVGSDDGPEVAIRFTDRRTELAILLDPELKLGEAYMDGTFVVEQGSIADFLFMLCPRGLPPRPQWTWPQWLWRYAQRRLAQFNPRSRARRNVAHHYDLDERLYSLFLDSDRQYSCAYFERPDQSLDDAQLAKKRHLAAKLILEPGMHVLEIGCGWGGLALYLAELMNAHVTGITLSNEQHALATRRASEKGLANRITFRLQDYRDVPETFDRIVSVGMFEHVGVGHYDTFFRKCRDSLADDGVMLLHSIGRSEGPAVTNPWVAKYIFPGGYVPALSEVLPAVERAGLLVTDIEILRMHYADTLLAWRQRFLAHRDEVEEVYDSRFVRMWEFYLAAAEVGFREHAMMVFQLQLTKQQGVVPVTRDYILYAEAQLRAREGTSRPTLRLAGE
jgi:cyclopropane-fatty-acyl-phospholipid synthase